MDGAVIAAWIAAGAAALSAAVNAYFIASSGRRQQENELVVSALEHFVGGSQERTAGLAALKVLSGGGGLSPAMRQRRSPVQEAGSGPGLGHGSLRTPSGVVPDGVATLLRSVSCSIAS